MTSATVHAATDAMATAIVDDRPAMTAVLLPPVPAPKGALAGWTAAKPYARITTPLATTVPGAYPSIPRREEFERWWAEQRGVAAPVRVTE